jgi:hypothetical protein
MKEENLKLSKAAAQGAYDAANAEIKQHMEKLYPGVFKPVLITDRVKRWEDACAIKDIHPVLSLPFPVANNDMHEAINATFKMFIICEVLCQDWKPDFSNANQYKFTPYFKWDSSGFGFSSSYYDGWNTDTAVGSRLVYPSSDLAMYAGTQFIDIYNKFLTKPNNETN